MPKLYYTTSSCGAASFISAFISGLNNLETEQVDLNTHLTSTGKDYYSINPKGNVPALVFADGTVLNEGAAILQYIADQRPGTVAPHNGTIGRYKVQEMLNYTASEVHASIGGLFAPDHTDQTRNLFIKRSNAKLTYLDAKVLPGKKFLIGHEFSIADAYLYIVLSWCPYVKVDMSSYRNVVAYFEGIKALSKVQEAHARMNLNPSTIGEGGESCVVPSCIIA